MSERSTGPSERNKSMSDDTYQYVGLVGFVVSGVFFLISALSAGDVLTILGSLTWIFACIGWGVPLERARRASADP